MKAITAHNTSQTEKFNIWLLLTVNFLHYFDGFVYVYCCLNL